MSEFLSLYDFLGKAAGSHLGKEVAEKASELKIEHRSKHVETKTYKGPVMMYPKSFLELYFKSLEQGVSE